MTALATVVCTFQAEGKRSNERYHIFRVRHALSEVVVTVLELTSIESDEEAEHFPVC